MIVMKPSRSLSLRWHATEALSEWGAHMEGVLQIRHSFSLAETGGYLVTLNKADHTPRTNYEITFMVR